MRNEVRFYTVTWSDGWANEIGQLGVQGVLRKTSTSGKKESKED